MLWVKAHSINCTIRKLVKQFKKSLSISQNYATILFCNLSFGGQNMGQNINLLLIIRIKLSLFFKFLSLDGRGKGRVNRKQVPRFHPHLASHVKGEERKGCEIDLKLMCMNINLLLISAIFLIILSTINSNAIWGT